MKQLIAIILLIVVAGIQSHKEEQTRKESPYSVGQIITPIGKILIWLYEETPRHRESFIELAKAGYWDSLTFNRVIDNFVAQGGCPDTPEGFNDPEYLLEPEFHPAARHIYGAVGAGRDDNPGELSARCQFYIVQREDGLARLDDHYTVFGQVMKGMDIVDKIVSVQTDSTDKPFIDITLDINIIKLTRKEIEDLGFRIPE